MADMGFLDGDKKISTGNKTPTKIEYDTTKAHIEQEFTIPIDAPYVQRAIDCVAKLDYKVVPNLKRVLELRNDGQKVMTYREADTIYRHEMAYGSAIFTITALMQFGCYITEDDDKFTNGIFVLRHRFNKGLNWLRNRPEARTDIIQEDGQKRFEEITKLIDEQYLPVHSEELDQGIHQEFLKPEHLAWRQFNLIMQRLPNTQTIFEKQNPSLKW